VARLAGIPSEVVQRARTVLADLESHQVKSKNKMISGKKHRCATSLEEQLTLFEAAAVRSPQETQKDMKEGNPESVH